MSSRTISFPHPVIGNGDDVAIGSIDPHVEYEITDESIDVHVSELKTGHPQIDAMCESGDVGWHIRAQCSRTYMRQSILVSEQETLFRLKGDDYEGALEIDVTLVAIADIPTYKPDELHADYGDATFSVSMGEVLGIGPSFRINVDKEFDPLKAPVASIVRITEGSHEDGPFALTLDDDLIIVRLSKSDWKDYAGIRDRVPTVVHSAIVLPALAEAISSITNFTHTLWGGRLQDVIDARGLDVTNPLATAQEALASPASRTFREVNSILDRSES